MENVSSHAWDTVIALNANKKVCFIMTLELSSHVLSFSKKLFLSVIVLFLAFAVCFMAFQYRREKEYKIELLNTQLQNYNDRLNDFLREKDTLNLELLDKYVHEHTLNELRVTLIDKEGKVLYDNIEQNPLHFSNHLNREEIKKAISQGSGYSINRQSESLGGEFFYSARYYPGTHYIIRSALPYSVSLMHHLKADSHFVWFTLMVSLVLIFIFYRFTHKLGMSITQLQQFALKADRNEPIDTDLQGAFPKNELGEISQHIIQIYRRLHQTKEDLYIEREKLITHLQISREGLGVFTHKKQEIPSPKKDSMNPRCFFYCLFLEKVLCKYAICYIIIRQKFFLKGWNAWI